MDDFGKRIPLTSILEELANEEYIEPDTARRRLTKVMGAAKMSLDYFKEDSNQVFFFEDIKEFIKALIIEIEKPYLKSSINGTKLTGTAQENYEEALRFKTFMESSIASIKNENMKENAQKFIEVLSNENIWRLRIDIYKKIEKIGKFVDTANISFSELNGVYMEIADGMERYYESLKIRFKK